MKPRLLDLFCKQGGAGMGYHLAGFDVIGVDIEPQPKYPFRFVEADAIELLEASLERSLTATLGIGPIAAIHASPPCQHYSRMSNCRPGLADTYPDLIEVTRDLLAATGVPYVIENVPGAPVRPDLRLCGCQFGLRSPRGLTVRRERWFELSFAAFSFLPPHNHEEPALPVTGHSPGKEWMAAYVERYGAAPGIEERRKAMGVEWMDRDGTSEAIPPAFTEFIGAQLLEHLKAVA